MKNSFRVGFGKSYLKDEAIQLNKDNKLDIDEIEKIIIQSIVPALLGAIGISQLNFEDRPFSHNILNALKEAENKIHYSGFKVNNIDLIVNRHMTELLAYWKFIESKISNLLFIKPEQIAIKFTQKEPKMGSINQSLIQCDAFISLVEIEEH
jgi:2C-methyl-D-erythritol 2,4-cyclodiphosphate synthase